MTQDQRSTWLQKLDAECSYQIVLPRRQLMDDSAIMDFLLSYVGEFDLYVEDQCPAYVRHCSTGVFLDVEVDCHSLGSIYKPGFR